MHTEDFEHLLDLPNAVAVDYDSETDTVTVFVREKVPEDVLDAEDLVSENTDHPTDVIELGEIRLEGNDHRGRTRPVIGGLSEGPVDRRSAGTGGPVAKITNPQSEYWRDTVSEGDLVRLSNNHVFAGSLSEPGRFGRDICQPARLDDGARSDVVGSLVGYVPFENGVRVDCAARTTSDDTANYRGLPTFATGVRRESYDELKGEGVTKSGRTTGVTEAQIQATSATVNVRVTDEQVVTFRDQIICTDLSAPGDSGSAVFLADGTLVGLLFAGSDTVTVCNKIGNVEAEFGVEVLPSESSTEPDTRTQTIRIKRPTATRAGSFAYSFDFSGDVSGGAKSHTVVDNRVNGYVSTWTDEYRLNGYVTDVSIPDYAHVELEGEVIPPAGLADRSQALARHD